MLCVSITYIHNRHTAEASFSALTLLVWSYDL